MKKVHEDKRYNRKSYNALKVANEVKSKFLKGEKINLTDIQVRNGYTLSSAKAHKAVKTKTYQQVLVPVIDRMLALRDKALRAIDSKELSKERLDSLVNLSKQMTHDSQLISGKSTENVATNIIVYGEDDFLSQQVK